jgi:AcrR family transcriptional regulator
MAKSGTKARVGRPTSTGVEDTREALVRGAIAALKEEGFAGASAREIARRAGCNQGLVFYHFGSVANLLLAALDEVSETRRAHYQAVVDGADGVLELVDAAQSIFEEDLDAGHIAVLAEMIAGASATPGAHRAVARLHDFGSPRRPRRQPPGGDGRTRGGGPCRRGALPRTRDAGAPRR